MWEGVQACRHTYRYKMQIALGIPRLFALLIYAMLGTRVDIAFSVPTLSRYLTNPTPAHIQAAKRNLRYLRVFSVLLRFIV